MSGTQMKAELSQAVGGDTRRQQLTRGEEVLPGHAGARNKWATSGTPWVQTGRATRTLG